MRFLRAAVFLPAVALASPLFAQSAAPKPYQFTIEDYARAERFLGQTTNPLVSGTAGRPTWLDDGRFWYRATTAGGGSTFYLVNPVRKTRTPAFDQAKLAAGLGSATGRTIDADRLPFQSFDLAADGKSLTITTLIGGRRWGCDLVAYSCSAAPTPAIPSSSSVSPDGKKAVFIREYNLWSRDLATGAETQLTTDGVKDFGYGTNNAGWVHNDNPVGTWSPDSRAYATFQHDGRGVRDMYLVTTNVGNPKLDAWKYPMPGDSVIFRISRVVVRFDGAAPQVVRLQMPPDAHRSTVSDHIACGLDICDVQWVDGGSQQLSFISSSRDHKQAWFRMADANTGAVRTVLEEKSATQIGDAGHPQDLFRALPASNELIWWSERDNWTHLYLYDLTTGTLKNRITSGDGNVSGVLRIDEKARQIWFTANGRETGRDPYFNHFYRIGFDGQGLTLLTPEVANHSVSLAPDGRWFVDTYSTPDTPPVTVLRDRNGKLVQTLEKADISRLVASGWRPPVPIRMKARDGATDIYGLMYLPTTLDTTRKYPIINHIYPGPQSGSVGPRSFIPARGDNQALAELGFVVVEIDGMGTPDRSKSFHDYYYGRMGDNTIPDQVAGMKELAQRYRYIDIDKVGIWGHSGGGFATASAMFRAPDFFSVGIAESGNHDNRNYEDDWGERYQGLLTRNGPNDNYAAEANQTYAGNLKGKLFLIHGMMDDNVPPYNTELVADALMKAGKDFDQIMLPHARHGYGADGAYIMRRRWDYFVTNLQGNIPPKEYQIGQPRVVP